MYRTRRGLNFVTFCLTLVLSLLVGSWPITTSAQRSITPPVEGKPQGTLPGGPRFRPQEPVGAPSEPSRIGQKKSPEQTCQSGEKPLTALMPANNLGLTVAAYPQFLFYVPRTSATEAEFVLTDENGNEVYITQFRITGEPGVISLSLPSLANFAPLEIGKDYRWYFSVTCNRPNSQGNLYLAAEGVVRRIEVSRTLAPQLEKATPRDRVILYAEDGIWYDAVTTLAELHRANPDDPRLTSDWITLLDSVGLAEFAEEPLVTP
ncbi:MAG TPA: hypothetical protein DDZ80_05895 [Cyanobacteria bacterium UBA8803]|nr:hypothetical protein [Cyanobacteria bacterium UBA9273]HBL58067.1 hypothetical protein [Cyanobacteria bacterium UBA8803]